MRGNVDRGGWAELLPLTAVVEAGPHQLDVLHILDDLDVVIARDGAGPLRPHRGAGRRSVTELLDELDHLRRQPPGVLPGLGPRSLGAHRDRVGSHLPRS